MTVSKRMLELKLTEPVSLQPIRIQVGNTIAVKARLLADNISSCEVSLKFDEVVLEETSGWSNPSTFVGPSVADQVEWALRGKRPSPKIFVSLEGRAEELFQKSEFAVEVTQ